METGRVIQALIIFSALLGLAFLWIANGVLPGAVFDFIAVGWALFVVDSALTFIRPVASYYLGLVLAVLALASSLPQSAHYALIENGQVLQATVFILGSAAQVLIILLMGLRFVKSRRKDEWAWPGAKSPA
ncbi:MAG: hypothetical protein OK438_06910 [Thaumarchaeota archaeon]|nr:hypothetical protein [Nitrososphaerota archaeon]